MTLFLWRAFKTMFTVTLGTQKMLAQKAVRWLAKGAPVGTFWEALIE